MDTDRKMEIMQETIYRLHWENERKDAEIDALKAQLYSFLPMKTWRVNITRKFGGVRSVVLDAKSVEDAEEAVSLGFDEYITSCRQIG